MREIELHWKTNEIVERATKYIEEQTDGEFYPLDWMYYEAGVHAEEDIRILYADWSDALERYTNIWDIDPDEYFTDEDWEDIERSIFCCADEQIEMFKEMKDELEEYEARK